MQEALHCFGFRAVGCNLTELVIYCNREVRVRKRKGLIKGNFELRDVCRSFVIGGLCGLGCGVIQTGYSPYMWLCFGTCASACAMSRAVHWKFRRYYLTRRVQGLETH